MEIKCKVCGAINDGSTDYCKECFVKLDTEKPILNTFNENDVKIEVPIEEIKESEIPWANNDLADIPDLEISPIEPLNIDEPWVQPEIKPIEESIADPVVQPGLEQVETTEQTIVEPMSFESIEENIAEPVVQPELEQVDTTEQATVEPMSFESIEENIVEPVVQPGLEQVETTEQATVEPMPIGPIEENIVEPVVQPGLEQVETTEQATVEPIPFGPIEENIAEPVVQPELEQVETTEQTTVEPMPFGPIEESIAEPVVQPETSQTLTTDHIETDDWDNDIEENEALASKYKYKNVFQIFVKFLFFTIIIGSIFGGLCIGFRYVMTSLFKMGINGELIFIVASSVTSVATLLIASDLTLKKTIPLASKINLFTLLSLFLVALPYLLIKIAYNLYIGTTLVILLILISLAIIILAIFFNYIRNSIREKHEIKEEDKFSFIYGVISILLVLGILYGVYVVKSNDKEISIKNINEITSIIKGK